jgi:hypothetical protein
MEKVIQSVAELSPVDRGAIEHILGTPLTGNEQLTICVEGAQAKSAEPFQELSGDEVPEAWKVYEGLSDTEIDKLDQAIRQRAKPTRIFK